MGIEPTQPAWKAGILPLNYTRTYTTKGILTNYFAYVNTFFKKLHAKPRQMFDIFAIYKYNFTYY